MQSLLTTPVLCIPVEFALKQIVSLNVPLTLRKLKSLQNDLVKLELEGIAETGIQITDSIVVTSSDMLEVFSGDYGDIVTAKGVALIHRMFNECYLEFTRPPTNEFPESLLDYIRSGVKAPSELEQTETPGSRITDLTESQFTYSKLYYLFESLSGTKQGKTILNISNKSVTRSTIKQEDKRPQYETVFLWENDSCRTIYLTRDGRL
jgi:hypothetical protein